MYTIVKTTYEENNYNFRGTETLIPALFESEESADEKILSLIQGKLFYNSYDKLYSDYMEDEFHLYAEYRVMRLEHC